MNIARLTILIAEGKLYSRMLKFFVFFLPFAVAMSNVQSD